MSFQHPTLLETAMHEAGHAYAFAAVSFPSHPYELALTESDAKVGGWCRCKRFLNTDIPFAIIPADVMPGIRWQAAADIVTAIAGTIAEARHRRGSTLGAMLELGPNTAKLLEPWVAEEYPDYARVQSTLNYMEVAGSLKAFENLIEVTHEIVRQHWPLIQRLGRELLKRRLLTEDDLENWFDRHPAQRRVEGLTL